jgi:UDP-glucose 4-epimerase
MIETDHGQDSSDRFVCRDRQVFARDRPDGDPADRRRAAGLIMVSMRILVTGHRGNVGVPVAARLRALGHEVAGFDLADGQDLLDAVAVRRAAEGCGAVVHLGALAHDSAGSPEQIMAVNVLGTWHVLLAAEAAGVGRVVSFSSAQVFGIAEGEQLPLYFPVDDAHPLRAMRPYGLSKRLAEELCDGFAARTGIAVVSLRPVHVWDPGYYHRIEQLRQADPASEWLPFWEYGAFVDARDVASAVECALAAPVTGHHRAVLCAADSCSSAPSLELAGRLAPGVPVIRPERYARSPAAALVDCSVARTLLTWRPAYTWSDRGRRPACVPAGGRPE